MLTRMRQESPEMAAIRRGIPADFLDKLEAITGSTKLNFFVMLLVAAGVFPLPEWLLVELLQEWKVAKLEGERERKRES